MNVPMGERLDSACKRAIAVWGKHAQLLMLIEEMAELQAAVLHWVRGRTDAAGSVIEEAADVELMLAQLRFILGEGGSDLVDAEKARKLARLETRLANAEDKAERAQRLGFCD